MGFPLMPMPVIFPRGPSATASPASVTGYGTGISIPSGYSHVTVTGGTATAYLWEKVSGGNILIASANSSSTNFTAGAMAPEATRTAVFRCKVTLSDGKIIYTNNVSVSISRAPM